MGAKLEQIYDIVTQKTGLKGRMRLADSTGVSRTKAAEMEDTDKLIKKFVKVASEIIGEDISELI